MLSTDPTVQGWLLEFEGSLAEAGKAAWQALGAVVWCAVDGQGGRAYLRASTSPGPGWVALKALHSVPGAAAGRAAAFHYVVETDVAPEHEADFNAWYEQEHLPGLARVPGAIHAWRYERVGGSHPGVPRYIACYDLLAPETLQRPEWLAVRHTDWSSRVRPTFVNPRRIMHRRCD